MRDQRDSNIISHAPISNFRGNELSCLDRLPADVRRALWETVIDWDARQCRWEINRRIKGGAPLEVSTAAEVQAIRYSDIDEIGEFSKHFESHFGTYPHVAANATILRYDSRKRHPPRMYR